MNPTFNENIPRHTELEQLNSQEREKIHAQSHEEFKKRLEENPTPTDDEKRLGIYIELIEPQIREALLTLTKKGYKTIDSGYDGFQFTKGIQYIGFEKGMIDDSLLPIVRSVIDAKTVEASIDFSSRDFFELTPHRFISKEEWKKIWDTVAGAFPNRGMVLPFKESFINKLGH